MVSTGRSAVGWLDASSAEIIKLLDPTYLAVIIPVVAAEGRVITPSLLPETVIGLKVP